jgi:hypothetical protein
VAQVELQLLVVQILVVGVVVLVDLLELLLQFKVDLVVAEY